MKTIPEVREDLLSIAKELKDGGEISYSRKIKRLVKALHRRAAVRRAKPDHFEFTPQIANRIRAYANLYPSKSYAAMSREFNVSIGRVSEVLAGKRKAA